MAAVFITQAIDMPLSLPQQITLLFVLLLTSKGAAGVTGAGFITLAATLPVVEHIPGLCCINPGYRSFYERSQGFDKHHWQCSCHSCCFEMGETTK